MATTTTATAKMKKAQVALAGTEFLSGGGADLTVTSQKKIITVGGAPGGGDPDDLDNFLSEITVQFDDDEVQTLYVGPVEIVDDDDDDDDAGAANPRVKARKLSATGSDDVTREASDAATMLVTAASGEKTKSPESGEAKKGGGGRKKEDTTHRRRGVANGEEKVEDSANDGRPHRLTAAAVVIDPKDGEKSQTVVANRDLKKPGRRRVKITPEKSATILARKVATEARVTRSDTSPAKLAAAVAVKPTAIISPSTKRKSPPAAAAVADQPAAEDPPATTPERACKRLKVTTDGDRPTTIKEEIKHLSPVLPPTTTTTTTVVPEEPVVIEETSPPVVQQEEQPEPPTVVKEPVVEKLEEAEQSSQQVVADEEEPSPEGELIVPDVLPPQEEGAPQELEEYNAQYNKEPSPAGSDSGIENEGAAELNKAVVALQELAGKNETVQNIPEGGDPAKKSVTENTHGEEERAELAPNKRIKCARCALSFKAVPSYKQHLMNYHGIDLSNIAHFLSNLQTLDEGIQDEAGDEEEYEEFQLVEGVEEGSADDGIDKTEGQQRVEPDGVARVRLQDTSSTTPSPATLQMYPEVKLSTKSKQQQQQQVRRRKDKLIPINSDADMKIKHEYITAMGAQSEESSGGSSQQSQGSSAPLLNNMFVVRYLEQAAYMAGSAGAGSGMLSIPDAAANKENSKSSQQLMDPLATDGSEGTDGMTPYERAKLVAMTTPDEGTQFTCNVCDTGFADRQTAQDHVNYVHKDVKRRSCPHCGRTFTQTGDLTRHVRIHTGIRPFKCTLEGCNHAFISSGDLHKHVRRHNQEVPKPHICGTCGKDFERGYDLKRHSSMHAKDDPNFTGFTCELCAKTFARKDQYRAHTYRHIGYKPHKCAHCDKSFSDASNYAKHLKVHDMDGIVLMCHHCDKPFKNKMAISKHVIHCKYKKMGGGARKRTIKKEVKKEVVKKEPSTPASSSVASMPGSPQQH